MKFLKSIFQGLSISALLFLLSTLVFAGGEGREQAIAFILIGLVFGLGSLIYEVDSLSLFIKTFIQCLSGIVVTLYLAYYYKWFPFEIEVILGFILVFLLMFFTIWLIFYFLNKREVSLLNNDINHKKQ